MNLAMETYASTQRLGDSSYSQMCPWKLICWCRSNQDAKIFGHSGLYKILDKIPWIAQEALSGQLRFVPLSFSHLRKVQGNSFRLSSRWSCLRLQHQNLVVRALHHFSARLKIPIFSSLGASCAHFLKKASDKMHSIFLYSSSTHKL